MAGMLTMLRNFLSARRFNRNLLTHFLVPGIVCAVLWLFTALAWSILWPETEPPAPPFAVRIYCGLVMALYFCTAVSCIRRRFSIPLPAVWIAAAVGAVIGAVMGRTSWEAAFNMLGLAVCIVVSCWTRNPLLSLLKVAAWFALCFTLVFALTFMGLGFYSMLYFAAGVILPRMFVTGMAYLLAPWLFLGGLPFGDENFRA